MKVNDVKEIAKKRGLNPGKMKKRELVRAIQEDEGNPVCYDTGYSDECGQPECLWRDDCQ
jgi:hypothetical protein